MKFLYGYFDQETGKSTVALADKYGTYIGQAQLHPNDKENASKYAGCSIAERRAQIKALRNKRRRIKIKIKTIKEILKDVENEKINIKLRYYTKELNNINEEIDQIRKNIQERIKIRNDIINKRTK